jgi:hypothetical protein
VLSAVSFKRNCNICGKEGHKASKCPKKDSVKLKNCGRAWHKKGVLIETRS